MSKEKTIKSKILEYIYTVSKQPILLKDLLVANRQYNEGMHVDPAKLGFRLNLMRAYMVYIAIVLAILVPISLLTHKPLAKIDPHISILGAMIITAAIFIGFNFFRDKMRDIMTKELIKKSWKLHFPFFSYEDYSIKIDVIFDNSIKDEISKRDLEKYILDKLTTL
ncbi:MULTISPECIES: hypothetical protein [Arcobacter]|jgi:hypothetical protein|uniref:Membrane protein n=1 Tax=Arcobacter ellisii TaxID=913109 RepID=A0A347U4W6_9BACT|nr:MULTISPECIES: hypothetical protein [Arcobacter]AXX93894.1 putative membrane protein [Arcobacter ellisii]MDD3008632.1 hypothetical protein [Arcobacter sp.]MDY3203582.1 hypothetical protein [Arcobacter sp.]RXI33088.1 hypothetical protein CP962_01380 [Arcobacter ellisii]